MISVFNDNCGKSSTLHTPLQCLLTLNREMDQSWVVYLTEDHHWWYKNCVSSWKPAPPSGRLGNHSRLCWTCVLLIQSFCYSTHGDQTKLVFRCFWSNGCTCQFPRGVVYLVVGQICAWKGWIGGFVKSTKFFRNDAYGILKKNRYAKLNFSSEV